jgi:ABC-type nitrate/sulfonate/bicarbonate transport system substrate-binding protein
MDEIKIGIGVSSIGRFLPLVGKAAGLFAKENISVEVVNQQDEEQVVTDIVTQAIPVGTPNAPSLIFSLLEGNDLVIVGGILNRPAFYLAANATIDGIADLKGKKVGINQPRRMAGMVMLALLRKWSLDTSDLTLVDLGINDRSLEALRAGEIAAALLPPEKAFLAETEGFRVVADSLALDCHWVPLATTRRFLAANRELVKKIASIYVESIRLFKSQPQATTLKEIGRRLPALEKKPEVLEKCYEVFAAGFEPTLTPSLNSINSILKEVALQDPRAREITAASIVEKLI